MEFEQKRPTNITNHLGKTTNKSRLGNRKIKRIVRSSSHIKCHHRSSSKQISLNSNDHCQITMIYLGKSFSQILILQQHSGGENILVFKQYLKQNEKFEFQSFRQNEYPFALTFYIDDLIDSRISVCCEYKHKLGCKIGGRNSSFAILNVKGKKPCQICRFNEYLSKQKANSSTEIPNEQNEMSKAKEMYEKLVKKLDKNVDSIKNSEYHYQLGNICKEGLNDKNKALEHYLISIEIFCLYNCSLNIKLRNIYLNIVHLLILTEKDKLAIKYLKRILDIDYSFNQLNYIHLINIHYYLSILYQNNSKFSKSLFHLNQILNYYLLINQNNQRNNIHLINNQTIYDQKSFQSLSIDQIPHLSLIYFHLAINYQKLGQKSNALYYIQKAIEFQTSDQEQFQNYKNEIESN